MSDVQPGDLLRIDTESGPKLEQITHVTTPYPPVLRALKGDTAEADTAFIAMADLQADDPRITPLANAAIPPAEREFPTFRLAVRDRMHQRVTKLGLRRVIQPSQRAIVHLDRQRLQHPAQCLTRVGQKRVLLALVARERSPLDISQLFQPQERRVHRWFRQPRTIGHLTLRQRLFRPQDP